MRSFDIDERRTGILVCHVAYKTKERDPSHSPSDCMHHLDSFGVSVHWRLRGLLDTEKSTWCTECSPFDTEKSTWCTECQASLDCQHSLVLFYRNEVNVISTSDRIYTRSDLTTSDRMRMGAKFKPHSNSVSPRRKRTPMPKSPNRKSLFGRMSLEESETFLEDASEEVYGTVIHIHPHPTALAHRLPPSAFRPRIKRQRTRAPNHPICPGAPRPNRYRDPHYPIASSPYSPAR